MKKLKLLVVLLLFSTALHAQWIPGGTIQTQIVGGQKQVRVVWGSNIYNFVDSNYVTGFTISSLPTVGQVVAPGNANTVIKQLYGQSQPPTASLTGGTVYELRTSAVTHNLTYGYGKQAATVNIASAVINPGSFNVFGAQPSPGTSVTGLQSVTTPTNTNTTYTILVTTTDSKTASATTTDTFLPGIYWGRTGSTAPSSSDVLAASGGGTALSAVRTGTFTIVASGSNHPFFTYPFSYGALTQIKDGNGLDVTTGFTQSTLTLTNASGFTQNYYVYTLQNLTSGNYTITTL